MADSDKDILITPNVSQTSQPEIKFVGKDNSPVYLKVLDDNTLSFEGTEGQVFSIGQLNEMLEVGRSGIERLVEQQKEYLETLEHGR